MATLNEVMKETADAIREKKGTTELIAPVDFAEEIKGITAAGGESASTTEYLDVSGTSSLVKASVVQHAIYVKGRVEAYGAKIVGVTLYTFGAMAENAIEAISAIAIDFAVETIVEIGGDLTRQTIKDAVLVNGATQADIDAIPRITKEQFYTLE